MERNVSLLCHRGDPLLVAGECPACQRPDCFHSREQVFSGKVILTTQEESPPDRRAHRLQRLSVNAWFSHELITTMWRRFQLQLKQECASTPVKIQDLCCSGSLWMFNFCRLKTKSNNGNLNLSRWGDICVMSVEFILTLQTFQSYIAYRTCVPGRDMS